MNDHVYHLEIITPNQSVFAGEVISTKLPGAVSPFQVLINHAPIVAALEVGVIDVVDATEHRHIYATSGGFAEMNHNKLSVTVETAEPIESIDTVRATNAAARAEERIRQARAEHDTSIDEARANAALARAENRLKLASRMGS